MLRLSTFVLLTGFYLDIIEINCEINGQKLNESYDTALYTNCKYIYKLNKNNAMLCNECVVRIWFTSDMNMTQTAVGHVSQVVIIAGFFCTRVVNWWRTAGDSRNL